MTIQTAYQTLKDAEEKIDAITHSIGILEYDGETVAPQASVKHRGETLAYLSEIEYQITTSKEVCDAVDFLLSKENELSYETLQEVKLFNREREYVQSIPVEKYTAFVELKNQSQNAWQQAKEKNDFSIFAPFLDKIIQTSKEFAHYYKPNIPTYNVLLDMFEKNLTTAETDKFFDTIKEKIVPLLQKIKLKNQIDDSFLFKAWDLEKQKQITNLIMNFEQIDRNRCVCGESEHPFTTSFTSNDVRITTHYYINNFCSNLFTVAHEGGHALYELALNPKFDKTPINTNINTSIHECQSRFFENIICRSKPFCRWIFPKLKEIYPEVFEKITVEMFYKAINKVEPSLIRTEADELTYPLHILIRYEIEKEIIDGNVKINELPALWNKKYKEYLGIDVPNDASGILQDAHWSLGEFGYFPSYAIGSSYASQIYNTIKNTFDFDKLVSNGDITLILDWFKNNIWQYGYLFEPKEIIEKATGEKFNPLYYINYLERKYSEIYDL